MQLAPLQIGILVNNVGVSYPHAEYYESIDDQLIDDLIAINIQATNKVWPTSCTKQLKLHSGCHVRLHLELLLQSGKVYPSTLRLSVHHSSC